jgi:hypothetical protein
MTSQRILLNDQILICSGTIYSGKYTFTHTPLSRQPVRSNTKVSDNICGQMFVFETPVLHACTNRGGHTFRKSANFIQNYHDLPCRAYSHQGRPVIL